MAWRGRKRELADRYPCGKLRPRRKLAEPEQPHRRGYGTNPLAETVHGRYFMDGQITKPQYTAGTIYARARLMYRAALGIADGLSRGNCGAKERDDVRDAKAVAEFNRIREAMGRHAVDVEWVVGADSQLVDLDGYRRGLDCLRRLWGV
jgi:hypothetical protein